MKFNDLIGALSKVNTELREQSVQAVNTALTIRNWVFGFYIVEFEQNGNDRAEYGKGLLSLISKEMQSRQISNTDERELRRCRQFYSTYPQADTFIFSNNRIRGLLSPEFTLNENSIENSSIQIRGTVSPEFILPEIHYD